MRALCNVAHLIRRATVHCANRNKQHSPSQRGNNLCAKLIRTTETWFSSWHLLHRYYTLFSTDFPPPSRCSNESFPVDLSLFIIYHLLSFRFPFPCYFNGLKARGEIFYSGDTHKFPGFQETKHFCVESGCASVVASLETTENLARRIRTLAESLNLFFRGEGSAKQRGMALLGR